MSWPSTTHTAWSRIKSTLHSSFRSTLQLYRSHQRSFHLAQVGYYGLIIGSGLLAKRFPSLREASLARVNAQLDAYEAGRFVVRLYESGQVLPAGIVTFAINLTIGAIGTITAPSFLLPFSGVFLAGYRAVEWGFIFSEVLAVWHWITLVLEGQAYVLAAWAAWTQSVMMVRSLLRDSGPESNGERVGEGAAPKGRGESVSWWKRADWSGGWRVTKAVYAPITAILLVSAFWEAFEVIYLTGMDGSSSQ